MELEPDAWSRFEHAVDVVILAQEIVVGPVVERALHHRVEGRTVGRQRQPLEAAVLAERVDDSREERLNGKF